jgi:outer membrane immunogenic protein
MCFPGALVLAASLAVSAARADDLYPSPSAPVTADFSGLGVGVDIGAGLGAANSANISGAVGGAHASYNLQNGNIVGGVEGNLMLSTLRGGALGSGTFSQDFLMSAAVRGGVTFGYWLPYATLGWAWTTTDFSSMGRDSYQSVPGVVYGVGAEYLLNRRISLRAELLRYDFTGASYATPSGSQSLTTSTNLFRLGVTARF